MTQRTKNILQSAFQLVALFIILVLLNVISWYAYERFDLTKEKRYTLSPATKSLLQGLEDAVYVKVYLEGDFPAGFKRLRNATQEMLDEFRAHSNNRLEYEFINPSEGSSTAEKEAIYKQLVQKGLQPTNLKVKGEEAYSEKIIFPGALLLYRGREIPLQLLESQVGFSPQEVLNHSIQLLEYKLAATVKKLKAVRQTKIGIIQGQGELGERPLADLLHTLSGKRYEVQFIDLPNTLVIDPSFDLVVIAKPQRAFAETEKFKLDQFIMGGGSALWLLDGVHAELDSLRGKHQYLALARDLNLAQDMFCAQIPLVIGSLGDAPQTDLFPWFYYPVILSNNHHPIVKNLDAVLLRFASTIDTVGARGIEKTILAHTSQYSKALMAPVRLHFSMLRDRPDPAQFQQQHLPVAVLLEGEFESVFKNRIAAKTIQMIDTLEGVSYREKGRPAKMIVVADGDVAANAYSRQGEAYPLGFYPITEQTFANKDFLLNCIEYLVDDSGLIATRNREVKLRLLDRTRIRQEKLQWQLINMIVPVLLVLFFGVIYNFWKNRKYAR